MYYCKELNYWERCYTIRRVWKRISKGNLLTTLRVIDQLELGSNKGETKHRLLRFNEKLSTRSSFPPRFLLLPFLLLLRYSNGCNKVTVDGRGFSLLRIKYRRAWSLTFTGVNKRSGKETIVHWTVHSEFFSKSLLGISHVRVVLRHFEQSTSKKTMYKQNIQQRGLAGRNNLALQ